MGHSQSPQPPGLAKPARREEARLPGVKRRMGDLESIYWAYKLLCETTHPTFVASSFAFDLEEDADPPVSDRWERTLPSQFVIFSALWTWILATELDKEFGEYRPWINA
jgi:hypothetical protein